MSENSTDAGLDLGEGVEFSEPEVDAFSERKEVAKSRQKYGWFVGIVGIVWVGIIFIIALCQLPALPKFNGEISAQLADISKGASIYLASILAAHAVIAVSGVWFGYQVLRAAERILVPLEYVEKAGDLLGVTSPHDSSAQGVKELLESIKSYLQDLLNQTKPGAGE